jgi:hypothetical protein
VLKRANHTPKISLFAMPKFLSLLLLAFLLFSSAATPPKIPKELAGTWVGTLTQNTGGYASSYYFELKIEVKDKHVEGTTFVSLGNEIMGEFAYIGVWQRGKKLFIKENRLLKSQKPEELDWCYKTIELQLFQHRSGEWRLEGAWRGESLSGICVPGYVRLQKTVPRA